MAEYVEQNLEGLLDVFEQLERSQLFSHEDVKKVVANVRKHEYRLQRRVKNSADFIGYVHYLRNFKALIRKRRKRLNVWEKKSEVEGLLNRKVDGLYAIVCERFPSELEPWRERVEFLKLIEAGQRVSRCYTRFLQVHNEESVWLAAVRWELSENRDLEAARSLLHRALRSHKHSVPLWAQLFHIELQFVDLLQRRRQGLEDDVKKEDMDTAAEASDRLAAEDSVLNLQLLRLVQQQALDAFEDGDDDDADLLRSQFAVVARFVELAADYEFAAELQSELLRLIETDERWTEEPAAWHWRIDRLKRQLLGSDGDMVQVDSASTLTAADNKIFAQYAAALAVCDAPSLWQAYFDYFAKLTSDTAADADRRHMNAVEHLHKLVAAHPDKAGEAHLLALCQHMTSPEHIDDLHKTVDKLVAQHPDNPLFWCVRIQILIDSGVAGKIIRKTFNQALKKATSESLPLWRVAFKWTTSQDAEPSRVRALVDQASATQSTAVASAVKLLYVDWLAARAETSEQQLHDEYMTLARQQPNTSALYSHYIDLLQQQNSGSIDKHVLDRIVAVYELWLLDENAHSVWLQYISFALRHTPGRVRQIYAQARARLPDKQVDAFMTAFALVRHNHHVQL